MQFVIISHEANFDLGGLITVVKAEGVPLNPNPQRTHTTLAPSWAWNKHSAADLVPTHDTSVGYRATAAKLPALIDEGSGEVKPSSVPATLTTGQNPAAHRTHPDPKIPAVKPNSAQLAKAPL